MTMTVMVHIEHKNAKDTTFQRRHDLRTEKPKKNIDSTRTHLNTTIILPLQPAALKAICLERRSKRVGTVRKMKSDAAIATRGIIGFGEEAQPTIRALPHDEQDRLFLQAAIAVCKVMGSEPTGLVVHRDEHMIHAHFQIPAYREDGTPNSKWIKKDHTVAMQDAAGSVYDHLDIHRGTPKIVREANEEPWHVTHHRTLKQLHNDLPREILTALSVRDSIASDIEILEREHRERMLQQQEMYDGSVTVLSDIELEIRIARQAADTEHKNLVDALKDEYLVIEKELASKRALSENKIKTAVKAAQSAVSTLTSTYHSLQADRAALDAIREETKTLRIQYDTLKTKVQGATDATVEVLFGTPKQEKEKGYTGARFVQPVPW